MKKRSSIKPLTTNTHPKINLLEAAICVEKLRHLYETCECKEIQKQIKSLIRYTLYFISERRNANYASTKAIKIWNQNTENLNLLELTVPKQRAYKKHFPFLKDLVLEHCNPLSILVKKILKDNIAIKTILKKELLTAWITKEENSKLNHKYKSKRPLGWEKCYNSIGIIIN